MPVQYIQGHNIPNRPIPAIPVAVSQKIIWKGRVGKSQASDGFELFLKFIAGHSIDQLNLPSDEELPSKGRIRFENLVEYLPRMKNSNRKHLSLAEVHPASRDFTHVYNNFCQYYREIKRGAVVDLEKKYGITIYIMPVVEDR
eukprot:UN16612